MGTVTPWGMSDHVTRYARGINFYDTPSHGGYKVSAKLNASMPEPLRNADGWYEEDCEWCKVVLAFPQYFPFKDWAAEKTLRNWFPDKWEAFYGKKLQPGESFKRDEQLKGIA